MAATERKGRLEIGVLYGFRALMVLFVVNYHIWQQGWLPQYVTLWGVQLNFDFFTRSSYLFVDGMLLLSGFLLYLPYALEREEGTPVPSIQQFYVNRVARIVPSYLVAVLAALLLIAIPQGLYQTTQAGAFDVFTHLTFTFTFFRDTLLYTPLNGALWTVAVEVQFYILFPLLARLAQKRPAVTLGFMAFVGWLYRLVVYFRITDTAMYLNQMPAFMDVYALGMLGAMLFCRLRSVLRASSASTQKIIALCATLVFAGSIALVLELLRAQSIASMGGHAALRLSQLKLRLPVAVMLLGCMLSAAYMPRALRWLLDNKLMRFLSAISFQLYIWHQVLAVQIARGWFPDTLHSDPGLQRAFTALCLSLSIVLAMAFTYGLEKPVAALIHHRKRKVEKP